MADSDPDMDAVLQQSAAQAPASMGDPDMDAVLKAASAPPKDPTLWERYLGFQESQLHGLTGSVASLAGGAGYLGALAETGDPEKAAATMRETQNALTYSPKSTEGKRQSGDMDEAAASLGQKPGQIAGDWVMDKTGSPTLGAATQTAFNVPQFLLGAKGGNEMVKGTAEPKPVEPSPTQAALKKGRDLGLVVPPSTTNPSLFNQVAEGTVGKISVAQKASIKNQPIIDSLAKKDVGLGHEDDLSVENLAKVRSQQSPAYEAVKAVPQIKLGPQYAKDLGSLTESADKISSELPDYKATGSQQVQNLVKSLQPPSGALSGTTAVELSKSLRAEASSYEASANRTLDPSDKALGRAYRGAATALENAITDHLQSTGQGDLATNWDNARRTIAKTYSVQDALDGAGHVDASKLAKQSIKGKPLSDNLETIADFANAFPKATKLQWAKESVNGLSPLDIYGGSALGLAAGLHSGEVAPSLVGAAVPLTRMAGRSALLSKVGQKLGTPSQPTAPGSRVAPLGEAFAAGLPGLKNDSDEH